jgi:hypothetical protein
MNVLGKFSKNTQISIFLKICLVAPELFHANGRRKRQTDITKLIVDFRNFLDTPKKKHSAASGKKPHVSFVSDVPNYNHKREVIVQVPVRYGVVPVLINTTNLTEQHRT